MDLKMKGKTFLKTKCLYDLKKFFTESDLFIFIKYMYYNIPVWSQSPLDQFVIRDLFSVKADFLANLQISLTNMGLYLVITTFIILMFYVLATNYDNSTPNRWSISHESIYATVYSIVVNQINANKGQMFFPLISGLFIYILVNNLVGMVPYSFAPTSHFILTFSLSFSVVIGATILGFQTHALKFFSLLVPSGCPLGLLPLLVLIEFISYLARNVSLGLRLAANVLSGHMLLNILGGFTYNIMSNGVVYFFLGLLPLLFIIAFSGLEIGIAFIQAQVFVVLSSSYIKDGLDLH
jgi:F-type H+-transporting ATPase subunit a